MSDVGVLSGSTPQICRLCLAQTTVCFSLIENAEASGMLEALTSLRILSTDEISTIMCLKCRLNLKLAFSIQQNMLKAEQRFRDQQLSAQIKEECDDASEIGDIEIEKMLQASEDEENDETLQASEDEEHDKTATLTYHCDICGIEKSSNKQLQSHRYNVHRRSKKRTNRDKDIKATLSQGHLEEHEEEHNNAEKEEFKGYTCEICGIVKASKKSFDHHNNNVHLTRKCPECAEDVKVGKFRQHLDGHFGTAKYICDICGVVKSSKTNLRHHMYNVHMSKKCPKCNKDVKLTRFKHHVDSHKNVCVKREASEEVKTDQSSNQSTDEPKPELPKVATRTYPCDLCGAVYNSQSVLNKHKYILHVEKTCPICGKTIKHVNLRRHIERHKNIQTVCSLCGITMHSQDLTSHMNYNHKHRSFKCQSCDKVYKRKQSLLAHEKREHLKRADFVCDTCGKRFHARVHLKKHINSTHLKLRPFICEFCKVGFSSRFALVTHRRQHTNETPYKCEYCSEGFRQKVSLRGHLRSKHNVTEKLICECSICGKKFASSAALIAHGRIH